MDLSLGYRDTFEYGQYMNCQTVGYNICYRTCTDIYLNIWNKNTLNTEMNALDEIVEY